MARLNERTIERLIDRIAAGKEDHLLTEATELVTAPRGWSQSTEDAFLAAGIDMGSGNFIPLSGSYEGPSDVGGLLGSGSSAGGDLVDIISGAASEQWDEMMRQSALKHRRNPRSVKAREAAEGIEGLREDRGAGSGEGGDPLAPFLPPDEGGRQVGPDAVTSSTGAAGARNNRTAPGSVLPEDTSQSLLDDGDEDGPGFWGKVRGWFTGDYTPLADAADRDLITRNERQAESDLRETYGGDMPDTGVSTAGLSPVLGGTLDRAEIERAERKAEEAAGGLTDLLQDAMEDEDGNRRSELDPDTLPTLLNYIDRLSRAQDGGTPFLPEGEEFARFANDVLDTEQQIQSLERTQELTRELGLDEEREPGALVRGLEEISRPLYGISGYLSAFTDDERSEEEADQSTLQTAGDRFLRGMVEREQFTSRDVTGVETEDMSWLGQAGWATSHFLMDVAMDPVSYVTLGTAGMSRRGVAEALERSVNRAASQVGKDDLLQLGRDGQERLLRGAAEGTQFDELVARAVREGTDGAVGTGSRRQATWDAAGRRTVTPETPAPIDAASAGNVIRNQNLTRLEVLEGLESLGMAPGLRNELLQRGLQNTSAGAFQKGGATAVHRELTAVFGDESVYRALDEGLQGGFQMTVPLASRQADFGRRAITYKPTGRVAGREVAKPIRQAAQHASTFYNKWRIRGSATRPGQAVSHVFGGKHRNEVKRLNWMLRHGDDEAVGAAWGQYRAMRDAKMISGEAARAAGVRSRGVFYTAGNHLLGASDPDAARDAIRTVWAAKSGLVDEATGLDDLGRHVVRGLDELDPQDVEAGRAAFEELDALVRQVGLDAQEITGDGRSAMNLLNNYAPRRIQEVTEDLAASSKAGQSARARADHLRARSGFGAVFDIDETTGDFVVRSWESAPEIVEDAAGGGRQVIFEDDPLEAIVGYLESMDRVLAEEHVLSHLRRLGYEPELDPIRWVEGATDSAKVGEVLEPASQARVAASQQAEAAKAASAGARQGARGKAETAEELFGDLEHIVGAEKVDELWDAIEDFEVAPVRGDAPASTAAVDADLADDMARELAADGVDVPPPTFADDVARQGDEVPTMAEARAADPELGDAWELMDRSWRNQASPGVKKFIARDSRRNWDKHDEWMEKGWDEIDRLGGTPDSSMQNAEQLYGPELDRYHPLAKARAALEERAMASYIEELGGTVPKGGWSIDVMPNEWQETLDAYNQARRIADEIDASPLPPSLDPTKGPPPSSRGRAAPARQVEPEAPAVVENPTSVEELEAHPVYKGIQDEWRQANDAASAARRDLDEAKARLNEFEEGAEGRAQAARQAADDEAVAARGVDVESERAPVDGPVKKNEPGFRGTVARAEPGVPLSPLEHTPKRVTRAKLLPANSRQFVAEIDGEKYLSDSYYAAKIDPKLVRRKPMQVTVEGEAKWLDEVEPAAYPGVQTKGELVGETAEGEARTGTPPRLDQLVPDDANWASAPLVRVAENDGAPMRTLEYLAEDGTIVPFNAEVLGRLRTVAGDFDEIRLNPEKATGMATVWRDGERIGLVMPLRIDAANPRSANAVRSFRGEALEAAGPPAATVGESASQRQNAARAAMRPKAERAREAIAELGETDEYRRLQAEVSELEDVHRQAYAAEDALREVLHGTEARAGVMPGRTNPIIEGSERMGVTRAAREMWDDYAPSRPLPGEDALPQAARQADPEEARKAAIRDKSDRFMADQNRRPRSNDIARELRAEKLPEELAGAKPKWKSHHVTFASDIDRALFITSQAKKSKRDGEYRAWLRGLGFEDADIDAAGQELRKALKDAEQMAAGPDSGLRPVFDGARRIADRRAAIDIPMPGGAPAPARSVVDVAEDPTPAPAAAPAAAAEEVAPERWTVSYGGTTREFATEEEAAAWGARQQQSDLWDSTADAILSQVSRDKDMFDELTDARLLHQLGDTERGEYIDRVTQLIARYVDPEAKAPSVRKQVFPDEPRSTAYARQLVEDGWTPEDLALTPTQMRAAGKSEAAADAAALHAAEASGLFRPHAHAESLARIGATNHQSGAEYSKMFFDQIWQPYYTTFKALATVGRGPGFSIRNALGGAHNAHISGARGSHFRNAEKMMRLEVKAKRKVTKRLAEREDVVPWSEVEQMIRDEVRASFRKSFSTKARPERGDRFFDALERFYDRNLMTGTRTDEFTQQGMMQGRAEQRSASRFAGGPGAEGLESLGLTGKRWARVMEGKLPTAGSQVDELDPALARGAGLSNTVFLGKQRDELGKMGRAVQALSDNPWVRVNAGMAELSEKYTRLSPFLAGLDRFGIEDGGRAAGLLVKASQFDYQDLSAAERRVLRNLMPFYTFSRFNIPFQVRGVVSEPHAYAKLGHAWEAAQDVLPVDERWEEEIFPRWVRDNMGVALDVAPADIPGASVLANIPVLGQMFESQHPISVNLSSLPAMDLNKIFGPSARDEAISMANPLIKTPLEYALDVDTFTRGRLPQRESLPDVVQGQSNPLGKLAEWLPGVTRDGSGELSAPGALTRVPRQMIPPVGQVERLTGSNERYQDRMLTSWLSNMAGGPVSTLDAPQLRANATREQQRLLDMIAGWRGTEVDNDDLRLLVENEVPIEIIEEAHDRHQLPELVELIAGDG